jgi:antitoxin component YwqK of YwqJK toxin-antitoxin module
MKQILLFAFLCVFVYIAHAQSLARHINFRTIDKDSVSLPLNEEYYLIEDSCAQIIRYSRFYFRQHIFRGKFKDVSKTNTDLIVSEGAYSSQGLKNGLFISHYLNGNLQAKGNFIDNKYDGKWEMYYENGKPELTFDVTDGDYKIIDAWGNNGKKTVDNGNGIYIDKLGNQYWKGKLVNGKPDGKWYLMKTDDASEAPIASEHFKNGQFRDGSIGDYDYKDKSSHIVWVDPFKLPFVNAEKMFISAVPCDGTKRKHIVGAQYKDGLRFFTRYIGDAVSPFLERINLKDCDVKIDIEGEISEEGNLTNLKSPNSTAGDISEGLILRLRTLPPLNPATADGKPIKQKFIISFIIRNGLYQYTYRFLPINID